MKDLCRICIESIEGMDKVSLTDSFKGIKLFEYINSVTNIVIKEDDGLPSSMCYTCFREFETVMHFREQCEKSDIKLKELVKIKSKAEVKCEYDDYLDTNNENDGYGQTLLIVNSVTPIKCDDNFDSKPDLYSDQSLSCDRCKAVFKMPRTLDIHRMKNKCKALRFQCNDCGEVFKSKCKIAVHWKQKHLLSKLICPRCKISCKSYTAFNKHKISSNICRKIDDQLIHINGVGQSRIFSCKECSYSTRKIRAIIVHVRSHTGERPYKCAYCHKRFSQISTLQFHQDHTHRKSFLKKEKCPICSKMLLGKKLLNTHISRCHNACIVKCTICNKSLLSRSLNMHMARHKEYKNYTCEVCASSFYSMSELCNHKRRVHDKVDKKIHCELCKYVTNTTELFRKHVQKHREGWHTCTICVKLFKNEDTFSKHQLKHLVEKKFQCPYCELKYRTRKAQLGHIRAKHSCTLDLSKNAANHFQVERKKNKLLDED